MFLLEIFLLEVFLLEIFVALTYKLKKSDFWRYIMCYKSIFERIIYQMIIKLKKGTIFKNFALFVYTIFYF